MSGQGLRLVCVLLGLALPLFLYHLPSVPGLLSLGLLAVYLYFWPTLRLVSFFILGFALSCLHLNLYINKQLPLEYEGKDVVVALRVERLPVVNDRSTNFEAVIVDSEKDFSWQERVRISWYSAPEIKVGEVWRLKVRLKRPRGFANGSGFDYQAWLLSQKIFATGYVRKAEINSRESTADNVFARIAFESLRELIDHTLLNNENYKNARFMRALLIGNKSEISQQDWQILQVTGTLHLMAISGLHIGLIATLGFLIGRGFSRLLIFISGSRHKFSWLAPLLSIVFAFVYAGFAGFSVPTQRAFLFVIMVNVALMLGRRINYFYALLLCAVLIALYDPFVFVEPGFYLSFCAVAVLFWCFMGRAELKRSRATGILAFIQAQTSLFIGLFLPLSFLSLPISLAGLLTNAVAIPVVGFLVVPLIFLSTFVYFLSSSLAHLLLQVSDLILSALWLGLQWFSNLKFASFHFSEIDPIAIIALCAIVAILLAPRAFALRLLCVPLLLIVFLLPPQKNEFELTVLDVGQGLAVYVQWPEGNLLYDTGARFSPDFDIGSRVIAPWLQNNGVNSLDFLVVSHGDNDHAGGMEGLLANVTVDSVWLGSNVNRSRLTRPLFDCSDSSLINGSSLDIKVLWPKRGKKDFENSNNASCVLLLTYKNTQILLTGDIEKEVEDFLVKKGTLPEDIDLLIAPHHGSYSSSTQGFLQKLNPNVAVFSVGYHNRYHHPHAKILERYQDMGVQIFRTDSDGAVSFTRDANGNLEVYRARVDKRRVWFW